MSEKSLRVDAILALLLSALLTVSDILRYWGTTQVAAAIGEMAACIPLVLAAVAALRRTRLATFWLAAAWSFTGGRLLVPLATIAGSARSSNIVLLILLACLLLCFAGFLRTAMVARHVMAPPDNSQGRTSNP